VKEAMHQIVALNHMSNKVTAILFHVYNNSLADSNLSRQQYLLLSLLLLGGGRGKVAHGRQGTDDPTDDPARPTSFMLSPTIPKI